jgi:hypothetical protein
MMAAIKTDGFLVAIDVFQRNDGVISTNFSPEHQIKNHLCDRKATRT